MRRIRLFVLALAFLASPVLPMTAQAYPPMWVKFSFPYLDPAHEGQTASGWFTFDGAQFAPGQVYEDYSGLEITSLYFPFAEHTWTTEDAGLFMLVLIPGAPEYPKAISWSLGSIPIFGGGGQDPHRSWFDLLAMGPYDEADGLYRRGYFEFNYHIASSPEVPVFQDNAGSWTAGIPEPGTLLLLGLGLLPLGLIRTSRGVAPRSRSHV